MKSIEQQLCETYDALEAGGKKSFVTESMTSKKSVEQKLAEAVAALKPAVVKHNGTRDNGVITESGWRHEPDEYQRRLAGNGTEGKKKLFEACLHLGMTSAEAACFAEYDPEPGKELTVEQVRNLSGAEFVTEACKKG